MRIALYGKSADSESIAYLKPLFERFSHHKVSYMIYKPFYEVLRSRIELDDNPVLFTSKDVLRDKADFLFSIGGDGTLLDTLTLQEYR